jgi:hypothetical protein
MPYEQSNPSGLEPPGPVVTHASRRDPAAEFRRDRPGRCEPCPVCGVDVHDERHFNKHLPERYGGPPKPKRPGTRERSLIDAIVEGDFDSLPKCAFCDDFGPGVYCEPDCVRDQLRRVANHRFFPTVEKQWAAAAAVLKEHRDAAH